MKVVVFGSGSFGTAMATVVARNGHDVVILTRRLDVMRAVNAEHRNPTHLTHFQLHARITADVDAARALPGADAILHAPPMPQTEAFLNTVPPPLPPPLPVVHTS